MDDIASRDVFLPAMLPSHSGVLSTSDLSVSDFVDMPVPVCDLQQLVQEQMLDRWIVDLANECGFSNIPLSLTPFDPVQHNDVQWLTPMQQHEQEWVKSKRRQLSTKPEHDLLQDDEPCSDVSQVDSIPIAPTVPGNVEGVPKKRAAVKKLKKPKRVTDDAYVDENTPQPAKKIECAHCHLTLKSNRAWTNHVAECQGHPTFKPSIAEPLQVSTHDEEEDLFSEHFNIFRRQC